MPFSVRQLFQRITGADRALTYDNVKAFVEDAGVESGFFIDRAGMAATAVMDKFDDGSGAVSWDRFRGKAIALVPPGMFDKLDVKELAQQLDAQWSLLDPKGTGSISTGALAAHLERELDRRGKSFSGEKADAGAKILVHALDENGNKKLERAELEGFLKDVLKEAGVSP
jgi:hypothetical protein